MFQHSRRHFLAVVRRHIVHKAGVRRRLRQQRRIHRVPLERPQPLLRLLLIAHTGPDVGIDDVGPGHGVRRPHQRMHRWPRPAVGPDAPVGGGGEHRFLQLIAVRRGNRKVHPHRRRRQAQAARHIVAVADVGQIQPVGVPMRLRNGHQIRQNLAGMLQIGQRIDHRNAAILGQLHQRLMRIHPCHDAVHIPAQNPRHIRNRLPPPQSHLIRRQIQAEPAQLGNANLKAGPRPQRRLFKQQCDTLAGQRLRAARRSIRPAGLKRGGPAHQTPGFVRRQVGNGKKIAMVTHSALADTPAGGKPAPRPKSG